MVLKKQNFNSLIKRFHNGSLIHLILAIQFFIQVILVLNSKREISCRLSQLFSNLVFLKGIRDMKFDISHQGISNFPSLNNYVDFIK